MIEKNINEVSVKSEPSARALIASLFSIDKIENFENAAVYHQFPIYPNTSSNNTITANVIFMSKSHGIFIFQCIDYSSRIKIDTQNYSERLSEIDRLIFAKILKESPKLQLNRRSLKVEIIPVIYINSDDLPSTIATTFEFEVVNSEKQLHDLIIKNRKNALSDAEYLDLKATIEGSKGIPRISDRTLKDSTELKHSKGAILTAIENEICNFDLEQKRAALFIVDGAQRIRGLAGSGKTIILAMKAAIIHLQSPEANILYTYYTKSLNDLVKKLITRFYRQFADRDPNWDRIQIMHAWGGKYLEGVYYNTCGLNDVIPINLTEAKSKNPNDPFEYVCSQLNQLKLKKEYDYALLDEAQDFPRDFYRVCRQITKNNRVIWAYDDFQNILEIKMQNERETFGKDEKGEYFIDFSRRDDELQDIILHRCYRNPRKILVFAFALGLGIYNKIEENKYQVIQRLESNEHWESLGFCVKVGDSSDNNDMVIERPEINSLSIKNALLSEDIILRIQKCSTFSQEINYVVSSILVDLERELKPEDISVICMDNLNAKRYFQLIASELEKRNIKSFNLLNAPSINTLFKVKDHVTLSTIYNAKGNEVGSVYIVGIDTIFSQKNDITQRNKIFTALTRSLAWVNMSGVGNSVDYCIEELKKLIENKFELRFIQPSENEVNTIRQGIDKKQKLLNTFERMADDLEKEIGLTRDEIVEQLKIKFIKKG